MSWFISGYGNDTTLNTWSLFPELCTIPFMILTNCLSLSQIKYGAKSESLKFGTQSYYFLMLIFVILLIPCVIVGKDAEQRWVTRRHVSRHIISLLRLLCVSVGGLLYHRQQHRFTDKMNRYIEDIELNIRNDIRQGQSQNLQHPDVQTNMTAC